MNRNIGYVLALILCITLTHAADAPVTLDGLKAIYEKAQASIVADCAKQKADALEGYGKALDAYLAKLKQQGKLADYLSIETEKKRFVAEKTIPAAEARSGEHIALAAKNYEEAVTKADADKQEKTGVLITQYVARLDAFIKDLMKADKISEAKAVQDEKQRVEFILATIPAAAPAVVKTETAPDEQAPAVSPVANTSKPQPKPIRTAGKYLVTKEITIDSNSPPGYELGAMKKGDEMEIQYISGKWADVASRPVMSPEDPQGMPIWVRARQGETLVVLTMVPKDTSKKPFKWRFDADYSEVFLGMAHSNDRDNAGAVTCKLTTRTANPLETGGQESAPAGTTSKPQPKDRAEDKSKKVTDGIVIWNSHNGGKKDYGSRRLSVICLSAGREVWKKKDVAIECEPGKDSFVVLNPPVVVFDTVRVEITQHVGAGASLSEIQVIRRGTNIAAGCTATASSVFGNQSPFVSDKLTDGVTTSEKHGTGYWVSSPEPNSWVEVDLGNKDK